MEREIGMNMAGNNIKEASRNGEGGDSVDWILAGAGGMNGVAPGLSHFGPMQVPPIAKIRCEPDHSSKFSRLSRNTHDCPNRIPI